MLTKNTEQLKQHVAEHIAADSVIQGTYWDPANLKGCFIGCLAHSDDPSINEKTYGLPIVLQRIAEDIFEALPADDAKAFFVSFPSAVKCDGKDLSKVQWRFLAAELRSLPSQPADIQAVIDPVIAGMDLLVQGFDWPNAADAAARADAAAADADADAWAADAAARSAAAAAWAAAAAAAAAADADADAADAHTTWAEDAAAAWAADAAARSADAAVRSAAAARLRQRDLLLQLIADAPVVEVCE